MPEAALRSAPRRIHAEPIFDGGEPQLHQSVADRARQQVRLWGDKVYLSEKVQKVRHVNTPSTAVLTVSLVVPGTTGVSATTSCHTNSKAENFTSLHSFFSFLTKVGKDGSQRIDIVSVEVNESRLFEPDLHSEVWVVS